MAEDLGDYVSLRRVANELGRQMQYVSYHLDGVEGFVDVSEGLDIQRGNSYHDYKIREGQVGVLIDRINALGEAC